MDCRDVDKLMDAFLERQVDGRSDEAIRTHLAACKECRRQWGGLVLLLTEPEPVEVPPGLRNRIVTALGDGPATFQPAVAAGGWRRRFVRLRYAGALAACLSFFFAGWLVSNWWTVSTPTGGTVADTTAAPSGVTVVVTPWIMSSMAQAAAVPAPISPAMMLASGVMPELAIADPRADEPRLHIYQRPAAPPATRPADAPTGPDLQLLPFVPRYLGA
jgi:hypothetical protein